MFDFLVDSDHGGNFITMRLNTGIFLFVDNSLTKSFSKIQSTFESSTFGSELVALRNDKEMIRGNENQVENVWGSLSWARKFPL